MKALVKSIVRNDGLENDSCPNDILDFCLGYTIDIGCEGNDFINFYQFEVCSIKWLSNKIEENGIYNGWGLIVVDKFEWSKIRRLMEEWVGSMSSDSWDILSAKASRVGQWEFDGYGK